MDRSFDYTQKILLAVEISAEPLRLADAPPTCSVFQRLSLPEIARAAGEAVGGAAGPGASPGFQALVNRHMSYWETRIPAGQHAFVHYAIGADEAIQAAWSRLGAAERWAIRLLRAQRLRPRLPPLDRHHPGRLPAPRRRPAARRPPVELTARSAPRACRPRLGHVPAGRIRS
jgi:hypothetical protein